MVVPPPLVLLAAQYLTGKPSLPTCYEDRRKLRIFRVDLDIEGGTSDHYAAFVNRIRSLSSGASKK